ncbi:protein BatD [Ginsengibacter hankyongi]|uniref:Protein BatD n=1 Tax=Ginsengibacter hankyongi TaxID=2607284 RepID=A0A5J5INZ5_9BACT|nr:protein BatD [Ginsengibacter hankyongi]KAA9041727.1 protein BatD [Ginsengibacter hankyongi]
MKQKQLKRSVYHKPLVITIFLLGSVLLAQNNFAQAPSIQTTVDKNNILIGEQFHYKVSTSMPDNTYRLSWFNMPDTLGHFQVVRENKIDSSYLNGNLNFSQDITITSFDSGRQVIPPLVLNMETLQGDSSFNLLTDSIPIQVSFSPMDSVQTFHDIKSIIEVKKEWAWWWWAILVVALILLFFWIRFLIKFFKKKNAPDLFKSKLSPYDEAMQSLNDLEKEQLLQQNEVKAYHTRLTDIFKRYISRKTKTYKMHLTSDEMLMDLDEYNLGKEKLTAFANCLRMSSAVKFAKYIPANYESEKCLQEIKDTITEINNKLNTKTESAV